MNPAISNWYPTILKLFLIEMDSIKVTCNIIKKVFIPLYLINRFLYFGHITKWTTLVSIYHIDRLDYIFLKSFTVSRLVATKNTSAYIAPDDANNILLVLKHILIRTMIFWLNLDHGLNDASISINMKSRKSKSLAASPD